MKFDLFAFDLSAVKLVIQKAALVWIFFLFLRTTKEKKNEKRSSDGKFDLSVFDLSVFDCITLGQNRSNLQFVEKFKISARRRF